MRDPKSKGQLHYSQNESRDSREIELLTGRYLGRITPSGHLLRSFFTRVNGKIRRLQIHL